MLPDETDFIGNAIGIDPSGCGCLECGNGSSIPEDETDRIAEAIAAHFTEGRDIISRIGCAIAIYQLRGGRYEFSVIPHGGGLDTEVVKRADYFDPETDTGTVIRDYYTPPDEHEGAVEVHEDAAMEAAIEKHFRHGEDLVNRTSETLIVYATRYGEFGHLSVDADRDEPLISVITS